VDPEFWHERWQAGQIAFHKTQVHRYLQAYLHVLGLAPGERVLVPLCGKSLDMLWLSRQGLEVLGVELSPIAVGAFFEENGLDYHVDEAGRRFEGGGVRMLCADFFEVEPPEAGRVHAVYDRAALIALPRAQRARYARHLSRLAPRAPILLVTLTYPSHEMDGPPFSVDGDEVHALFADAYRVRVLDSHDVAPGEVHFRDRLSTLVETAYLLTNPNV